MFYFGRPIVLVKTKSWLSDLGHYLQIKMSLRDVIAAGKALNF